jgi:tetratricopeptide (TPR) repeat protein
MQAVFDYFWQLLAPEEQITLKKQAVFRGGFTREAFLAVTETDLAMLARLMDKSAFNFGEDGRYRRHPLMAKFSAARLADDPELEAESRECHARYFSHFVKYLEPELLGGQPQKALTPLLADLHNIRLAWDWAVEHPDASIFNDMSDSVMQIFDLAGLYREAREMAEKAAMALQSEPVSQDVKIATGRVTGLLGAFLFRLGEYQQAMDWCEKSLQTLEEARPHIAYAHTLIYAGASAFGVGDFERVISNWKSAAEEYRTVKSNWGDMIASSNLAEAMIATGNFADGKFYVEHALALAREMNNLEMTGAALTSLASLAMREEKFPEAIQYAEEALNSHQQVGHDAHIANSLAILAQIAFKQHDLDEAHRLLEESIGILKRVGNRLYLEQRTQELNEVLSAQSQ